MLAIYRSAREDRGSADAARGATFPNQGQALLRRLRVSGGILGQAAPCDRQDRMASRELFPLVGFIATNMPMDPDWIVWFYYQRGTTGQHIKEGMHAFSWTRLSCRKFRDNAAARSCSHPPIASLNPQVRDHDPRQN